MLFLVEVNPEHDNDNAKTVAPFVTSIVNKTAEAFGFKSPVLGEWQAIRIQKDLNPVISSHVCFFETDVINDPDIVYLCGKVDNVNTAMMLPNFLANNSIDPKYVIMETQSSNEWSFTKIRVDDVTKLNQYRNTKE